MIDRQKLARVLAMIGSSFDGEALAAARRAHEMAGTAGGWEAVLTSDDTALATEACRRLMAECDELRHQLARARAAAAIDGVWNEPGSVEEAIDVCIGFTEWCNDWEREFVVSLAGWRGALTVRQRQRLGGLVAKLRRIALAKGMAA